MRRRALLAAFTALVAGVGAFGVRLETADAAPISFSHPGVLVSRGQLDFVKGRVNAGAQPWLAAYAPLQTGWAGSVWPRAAEIIRHTYGSWSNQARFATMLRTVYLPVVIVGSSISYWHGQRTFVDGLAQETCRDFTQQYTESHRPQGTNGLFVAGETLTHANNPA